MTKIWRRFRRLVAQKVLRGPLMELWLHRLTRIFAIEYARNLKPPLSAPAREISFRRAGTREKHPAKMLFLCDNMWEKRELKPELEKIGPLDFIDVQAGVETRVPGMAEKLQIESLEFFQKKQGSPEYGSAFVYLRSSLLSTELIERVRRMTDGPVIGINLDDKGSFFPYSVFQSEAVPYARWAGNFDLNLTNSRNYVDIYREHGFPCAYLPTAFHYNPELHLPVDPQEWKWPISFVGSCKIERRLFMEDLQARGLDIKLFGNGWENGEFVKDGWKIFRQSQINLGCGYNIPGRQITNLKNRDFECPGSGGGCYLTTYDWELAELFDIGKEILCYRDVDDLMELYHYYRPRPDLCLEIARAGQRRAINEHTWEKRFRDVLRNFE